MLMSSIRCFTELHRIIRVKRVIPAHKLAVVLTDQLLLLLHPFNSLFSRTTWVSWYQKGKTSLDF